MGALFPLSSANYQHNFVAYFRIPPSTLPSSLRTSRVVRSTRVRRIVLFLVLVPNWLINLLRLRPKALDSGFFSFLFPKVPLVPPVPDDVSNAGRSPSTDARLFPSDEELSQRSLWLALLVVLVWSVLGLAGGLPLYLIDLPCNSQLSSGSVTGYGGYSTLTDISLLRLLRVYDKIDTVSTSSLQRRAPILDNNDPSRVRLRFIILTALVVILGVFPLLFKILREFNNLVAYRSRWLEVKCDGRDLAWLSVKNAPGFKNWGEKQFKDYLVKIGLSSTLGDTARRNANGTRRNPTTRRREEEQPLTDDEFLNTEVDIQTLFSIGYADFSLFLAKLTFPTGTHSDLRCSFTNATKFLKI